MLTENFPGRRKVTKCSILPQSRSLSCNSDVHLHSLAPESLNFPDHFDKNIIQKLTDLLQSKHSQLSKT